MDKTNVTIRIPGRILTDDEHLINVDDGRLVERLIPLLQARKNMVQVTFQSYGNARKKNINTIAKIEILLSDEMGNFNYYED